MADLFDIADMVEKMVDGFVPEVVKCLGENAASATLAVTEQMYSGQDGEGQLISPNYDNDPYFEEKGPWHHRAKAYKMWKMDITPPTPSVMLNLPPRPDNVPNLYINGKFHSEVFAQMEGDELKVDVLPTGDGPDIVNKYGDQILQLGPPAVRYFANELIMPHVWKFFESCGYK